MRSSYIYTIGGFLLVVILINLFFEDPTFRNLTEEADFELEANQPDLADETLFKIVSQDQVNLDYNYEYIGNHFNIPKRKKNSGGEYEYRDDQTIKDYYNLLSASTDSLLSDIGHYGNGLIASKLRDYSAAISEFKKVKNKQLKYLNNSLGYAYSKTDSAILAEQYFRKEIENKGNLSGAYHNLIQLLFDKGETSELKHLLSDKASKKYFPPYIERTIYFRNFQPIKYANILFKRIFSGYNLWGFVAAFLIMGSWIMYLRKIDIFDVEKWRNIILVVALGMLFCFITFPLTDFNNNIFGFKLNGNPLNDFLYCVIGIGAIEEFAKIIPLLIILRFTKIINEPFDYIVYASLSALGFAFIENLIYINESHLQIIHGRAMVAVVSHMFYSSIIAYGIILNKYKRHKNPFLNFILFFILAAIAHGFYDFWLINEAVSSFNFLTILFFISSIFMWNSFKNNALNQSAFFDKEVSINKGNLQDYLLYSLAGILLFEYVALSLKFSPSIGNRGLFTSVYSGSYLIAFLTINLSQFNLNKGEWAPIRFAGFKEKIHYKKILELAVHINRFTKSDLTRAFLPNSGKVIKMLTVSKEPDWYIVKLDESAQVSSYLPDTIIMRTKDKGELMDRGNNIFIAFYLIPNETDLEKKDLSQKDFKFCGWAKLK